MRCELTYNELRFLIRGARVLNVGLGLFVPVALMGPPAIMYFMQGEGVVMIFLLRLMALVFVISGLVRMLKPLHPQAPRRIVSGAHGFLGFLLLRPDTLLGAIVFVPIALVCELIMPFKVGMLGLLLIHVLLLIASSQGIMAMASHLTTKVLESAPPDRADRQLQLAWIIWAPVKCVWLWYVFQAESTIPTGWQFLGIVLMFTHVALIVRTASRIRSLRREIVRFQGRHWCPKCGYDLRGLPNHGCPECGRGRDDAAIAA